MSFQVESSWISILSIWRGKKCDKDERGAKLPASDPAQFVYHSQPSETTTLNYFLSYKFNIQLKARKVAVPSTSSPTQHRVCTYFTPEEKKWYSGGKFMMLFFTYMRKVFPFFPRTRVLLHREKDDMATVFSVVSLLLFKSSHSYSYARMEWTCNWKFHINEFHEISQMFTVETRKKGEWRK